MIIPQPFRSDPQKVFSGEAHELGAQLAALVEANIGDLVKLETLTLKAGFKQDSVGQWFHVAKDAIRGLHVPTPTVLQPKTVKTSGVPQLF